jgi:hypothetical protein
VYRCAIAANRHGALLSTYPVVARIVGEAFFAEAALQYCSALPPATGDLNRHGATFAFFLETYLHAAAMPWLADVARLEWAWHESLPAADAPAFDFGRLAGVPEAEQPHLVLALHPSVRLVRSAWPVYAIWEANQPERDGAPDREAGADDVLVWREANRVRIALLTKAEADVVERLLQGGALGEIAGAEAEAEFAAMLPRLAGHGMLAGFAIRSSQGG